MKIAIIGGGNMGGAIARGLATGSHVVANDITIINKHIERDYGNGIVSVVGDYSNLASADVVVLAVKPWMVSEVVSANLEYLQNSSQLFLSVVAGLELKDLGEMLPANKPIFRVMPNTAISLKQSMTFISSNNASSEQQRLVYEIFSELGTAEIIEEKLFTAATSISGCGIAYALRYIRASEQGGVEMGLTLKQAQTAVLQTLKGAVALLETNQSHPEAEIDKVTTPGGLTIKGLNEMEYAGFSSAVIRGLKASR